MKLKRNSDGYSYLNRFRIVRNPASSGGGYGRYRPQTWHLYDGDNKIASFLDSLLDAKDEIETILEDENSACQTASDIVS